MTKSSEILRSEMIIVNLQMKVRKLLEENQRLREENKRLKQELSLINTIVETEDE